MYVSCRTVKEFSFKNGRSILLAYDDDEDFDFSFATEEGGDGSVMATAIATAISIAVAPPAAEGIIEIPGGRSEKKCLNIISYSIKIHIEVRQLIDNF